MCTVHCTVYNLCTVQWLGSTKGYSEIQYLKHILVILSTWWDIPYCKWNTFYLQGKMLMEPMTKNAPSNSNKNPRKPPRRKPRFDTQSPGKGGPVTCSKNSIKVKEFFLLNPPAQWVNKRYPLLLANMRYIRDGICTGHIRRRVYFSSVYLQVKKIQSILTKNQSINCLYECRDWTMNGRGGGKCFPPTKEIGTRVEDSTTRPNNIRSSGESGFQGTSSLKR